ncbi:MAG: Holliday junction branch migration protein RuvA [Pseudomonadota bacterium]
MIASLEGRLLRRLPQRVTIDVGGVGYAVEIPLSTYYVLPPEGQRVLLLTHLHLQDDALRLFGFATVAEREMFLCLISVSRIGPKAAMGILSGIGVAELRAAVLEANVARLARIPGVGKKSAERLALELKEKVVALDGLDGPPSTAPRPEPDDQIRADALSALLNLGYHRQQAEKALADAWARGEHGLEAVLRAALNSLT